MQASNDIALLPILATSSTSLSRPTPAACIVRLAFAVIAHVDADILVIDEALAVGDAVFTQKCMRFLRRFRKKAP